LLISCSKPKPAEEPVDSVLNSKIIITDSAVIKETFAPCPDTTYLDSIPNNPDSSILRPNVAYVYNRNGLDVYEVIHGQTPEKVIGHLDYGSKLDLLNPLRNETPLTVDGIRGYYAILKFGDKIGYVFTGYLLNYPLRQDEGLEQYLIKTFHSEKPARIVVFRTEDSLRCCSGNKEYYFEQGITMKQNFDYEYYDLDVRIPGMTLQQAWLFYSTQDKNVRTYIPLMPTDSCLVEISDKLKYSTKMANGTVSQITFYDETGCSFMTSLSADAKGARIVSGGGC